MFRLLCKWVIQLKEVKVIVLIRCKYLTREFQPKRVQSKPGPAKGPNRSSTFCRGSRVWQDLAWPHYLVMSLEMYGPPEREAQGRGLMKREKEGAADSSRTESTHKKKERKKTGEGGGKRGNWERTGGEMLAELGNMERWRGGMDYSGEWRN